jgi:hypothetical protein
MYLGEYDESDGLGFSLKKLVKKVVQPVKHLQTKAPEIGKIASVVSVVWPPAGFVAAGAKLATKPPKARKVGSAFDAEPTTDIAPPSPTAPTAKILVPLAGAAVLAWLAFR